MKKYCQSCGTLHEFTLTPPRFCENCGTSFGGAVAPKKATATIVPAKQPPRKEAPLDEQLEDADKEVPQISRIEVEIEVDSAPKITFGNAKNARSFSRDKTTKPLTENDLNKRLDNLFARDRQDQKESQ